MTLYNHVSQKAKSVGLKLLPTLGAHYLLVPTGIVYSCFQKCLYKGSLYEVDTFLNLFFDNQIENVRG